MNPRVLAPLALLVAVASPSLGQGITGAVGGSPGAQRVTVAEFPVSYFAPSSPLGAVGVAAASAPLGSTGRPTQRVLRRIAVGAGTFKVPGVDRVVEAAGMSVTEVTDRAALLPSLRKVGAESDVDRLWASVEGFRGNDGKVYAARYVGQDHAYSAWVEGTLVIVQQGRSQSFLVFHVQEYGE